MITFITEARAASSDTKEYDLLPDHHGIISLGSLNTKHEVSVSFESDNEIYVGLMEDTEIGDFISGGSSRREEEESGTSGGFEDYKIQYESDYSLVVRNYGMSSAQVTVTYKISGGFNWTPIGIAVIVISLIMTVVAVGVRAKRGEKVRFNRDHKGNTKISFEK